MIFNLDFTPLSEMDSKGFFFEKQFLSVELLGVFMPLILIDGAIILTLHILTIIFIISLFDYFGHLWLVTFISAGICVTNKYKIIYSILRK